MKTLLLLLAAVASLLVLLVGAFQFLRIVMHEVVTLIKEAWHTPEIHG
jgi:hypothetical protein